jgi:predicted lysophospholipase L1 biosynthesis ABC-type transport system permease subunit
VKSVRRPRARARQLREALVAVTAGTLAVVTALALIGPLRRARRIHPMELLRQI